MERKNYPKFKNKSFYELTFLIDDLSVLFLNKTYGKNLFNVIESTNIFKAYTYESLRGLDSTFRSQNENLSFINRDSKTRNWFFINVNETFDINFQNISLYLQPFQDFIPLPLIKHVSTLCYETKTVYLLHYLVQMYVSFFDITKTEQHQKNEYYKFISLIKVELEKL